jgi:hypothetical protein
MPELRGYLELLLRNRERVRAEVTASDPSGIRRNLD